MVIVINSREYWLKREEEALKKYIKEEKEYDREIKRIYANMLDACQKEIDSFYSKYASAEGITLAEAKKRVSQHDVRAFERKAAKYVKDKDFSKKANEELRLYIGLFVAATVAITLNVWHNLQGMYATTGETIRHAAFQVSSIMTTTGFSTTDFDGWPALSKGILLMLMLVGACAGSTGGGFKCARVLLIFKSLRRNIRQVMNPRKVLVIRNNGRVMDEKVVANTNAYLSAYVIIIVVAYLMISIDGFSIGTNLSAVLACFNNIGPGFEAVGPTCNFGGYSDFSKFTLSLCMLAGRLEIFPILALLSRGTWKRK